MGAGTLRLKIEDLRHMAIGMRKLRKDGGA
ncbi:hypothetical protein H4683_002767 [Filibacter limicola]|uniref:Uncharacterized protein n=1 Tax=Sporosarcina limicola TaxID=34101 RepID=A0A927RFM1_9BACL|nr:hypothetical protein [Sporosarcina limicola]